MTDFDIMSKEELFDKSIHSLFGVYLDDPKTQQITKNSGLSLFRCKWRGSMSLHICIWGKYYVDLDKGKDLNDKLLKMRVSKTYLSKPADQSIVSNPITTQKKDLSPKETMLRLRIKGISKADSERYSKLHPISQEDHDQLKLLFLSYDAKKNQLDSVKLPHDLNVFFWGDINPNVNQMTEKNKVFFRVRLSIPKDNNLPISWEISPLTSKDGVSFQSDCLYQFNDHREKDLNQIADLMKSLLNVYPHLNQVQIYPPKKEVIEIEHQPASGNLKPLMSMDEINHIFSQKPSEEKSYRYLASLLRKMERIKQVHQAIKQSEDLLNREIDQLFLIADPTPKDLAGDNLFKSLHQALLMDRHLKRLQSIDVNFISDWVRSNIDQTHDDLFRDYVRHVLDISMMKKDLIIAAGNELDDLKDQLNSLKFQFKAELKTFFDLQNNFTSLLDIWRETHEKFEGAI